MTGIRFMKLKFVAACSVALRDVLDQLAQAFPNR